MTQYDTYKPIRIFGYCFVFMGGIGLIMHFLLRHDVNYTIEFSCFVLTVTFLHFLLGIGVLFKKIWSYHIFRMYLYLLCLALPVGTYVAIKTFKYIEKHRIEDFFK
jgi:hypothetical protein